MASGFHLLNPEAQKAVRDLEEARINFNQALINVHLLGFVVRLRQPSLTVKGSPSKVILNMEAPVWDDFAFSTPLTPLSPEEERKHGT